MQTPEEVFKALNLSRILIAILEEKGEIGVKLDTFLGAKDGDRGLNVEFDNETQEFKFKLKEEETVDGNESTSD